MKVTFTINPQCDVVLHIADCDCVGPSKGADHALNCAYVIDCAKQFQKLLDEDYNRYLLRYVVRSRD